MSRSNPEPNYTGNVVTDRHAVLTFGKYKGESIQDILDNDPKYLLWLHENTEFELGFELLEEAEDAAKPEHSFKGYTSRYDARD